MVGDNLLIGQTSVQVRPLNALDTTRMTLPIVDGIDALVPVDRTHVMVGVTPSLMFGIPPIGGAPAALPTTYTDYDLSTGKPVDAPFGAPSTSNTTSLVQAAAVGPNGTLLAGTSSGSLVDGVRPPRPPRRSSASSPDPVSRSGVIVTRADGSVLSFDARSRKSRSSSPQATTAPPPAWRQQAPRYSWVTWTAPSCGSDQGTDSAPATLLHLQRKASRWPTSRRETSSPSPKPRHDRTYDAATGKLVRTLPHVHHTVVPDIAFSPDGTHLASSDVKDTIPFNRMRGDATALDPGAARAC